MIFGWLASNGRRRKGAPDLRDSAQRLDLRLQAESDAERALLARLWVRVRELAQSGAQINDIQFVTEESDKGAA
jgi:hypothetical protein